MYIGGGAVSHGHREGIENQCIFVSGPVFLGRHRESVYIGGGAVSHGPVFL